MEIDGIKIEKVSWRFIRLSWRGKHENSWKLDGCAFYRESIVYSEFFFQWRV